MYLWYSYIPNFFLKDFDRYKKISKKKMQKVILHPSTLTKIMWHPWKWVPPRRTNTENRHFWCPNIISNSRFPQIFDHIGKCHLSYELCTHTIDLKGSHPLEKSVILEVLFVLRITSWITRPEVLHSGITYNVYIVRSDQMLEIPVSARSKEKGALKMAQNWTNKTKTHTNFLITSWKTTPEIFHSGITYNVYIARSD